jgi:hypothetical protein
LGIASNYFVTVSCIYGADWRFFKKFRLKKNEFFMEAQRLLMEDAKRKFFELGFSFIYMMWLSSLAGLYFNFKLTLFFFGNSLNLFSHKATKAQRVKKPNRLFVPWWLWCARISLVILVT